MAPAEPPTLGFIGLGQIGAPIAQRILDAGYEMLVCDVKEECIAPFGEQGVPTAATPRAVADRAEVVFVSLPTPAIVTEVAVGEDGLANGQRIRLYVDLSTTGPAAARQVAEVLDAHDITCIDAPVSGGASGARDGTLTVMSSGDRLALDELMPILATFGRSIFRVGDAVGLGQAMKLANNMLAGGALSLTAEAMAVGVREGLNPSTMIHVFNAGSGLNTATRDKFPNAVLTGTYDYGFRAQLMSKDLGLAMARASELDVPVEVCAAVAALFERTVEAFPHEDVDFTMVARYLEELAGVRFQSAHDPGALL